MTIQDIEAFVAVAETGSVSRAAVRLSLTQPATTRRIQNFEASLGGAELFNRSVKPAALTVAGQHVLERCRQVLTAMAELEACATHAGAPGGNLKAGVAHGLGEMVLTAPLDALRRAFPDITLQISSDWSSNLMEQVRSGALDFAIGLLTEAHTLPAGLIRVPLGSEQIVVVGPADKQIKKRKTASRLRDLANQRWFLNPVGCGCRAALSASFDRLQLPLQVAAEIFGEDLQLALIAHGGGLGLVPRRQFEQSSHRRELRMLDVVDFQIPAAIALIRPSRPTRFDPAMDRLATVLKTQLRRTDQSA